MRCGKIVTIRLATNRGLRLDESGAELREVDLICQRDQGHKEANCTATWGPPGDDSSGYISIYWRTH